MAYTKLATIYDKLMADDINYDRLCDQIERCFNRYSIKPHLIADLACGTGSVTSRLANRGYEMIGVDLSEDMLDTAKKKDPNSLYLNQDIANFEFYGTVDAILCMIDGYNYVLEDNDLYQSFLLAKNYLNPGGLFLFDMSSFYKLSTLLGNETFVYDDESIFYTWENEFDTELALCSSYITFFVKENHVYHRFDEEHIEKARHTTDVISLLEKAGFSDIRVFDENYDKPTPTSKRIFFSSIIHK